MPNVMVLASLCSQADMIELYLVANSEERCSTDEAHFSKYKFCSSVQTVFYYVYKSKEEGKYQESIQSSTTPDSGHHIGN